MLGLHGRTKEEIKSSISDHKIMYKQTLMQIVQQQLDFGYIKKKQHLLLVHKQNCYMNFMWTLVT
jgi:hypothetical protein